MFEWHKKEKGANFLLDLALDLVMVGGGGLVSYDATGGTKIASGDYNLHFFTATGPGTLVVLFLILVIQE